MKELDTIPDDALGTVVGGKQDTPTHDMSNMGGGSSDLNNDAVLAALRGIQDSINDLGKNNGGLFGGNNGLMFMTMMLAMQRRGEVVVYGNRRGSGYYFRSY